MYKNLYYIDLDKVDNVTAEFPSVDYCHKYWIVIQVVGKTITILKLAKAVKWNQLFTDATTWHQFF